MEVLREEFVVDVLGWCGGKGGDNSNEINVELSVIQ